MLKICPCPCVLCSHLASSFDVLAAQRATLAAHEMEGSGQVELASPRPSSPFSALASSQQGGGLGHGSNGNGGTKAHSTPDLTIERGSAGAQGLPPGLTAGVTLGG